MKRCWELLSNYTKFLISYFLPKPNFLTPNLDFFFVDLSLGVGDGGAFTAGALAGGTLGGVRGRGGGAV